MKFQQVHQQDAHPTNAGMQLKLCITPRPFSKATSPSVADCMPLSSLLKTTVIKGGV